VISVVPLMPLNLVLAGRKFTAKRSPPG